ncbi:MAG: DUF1501 domain-containing protein [Propionibacteriaceae bacterium]|nr:DUF1501 domain-containing protein [Propionibacteriaceae bacterium]
MPHDELNRFDALLHEDLVVPMHHHDSRRDALATHVNGYAQAITAEQAGALVAERAPTPGLGEVDHVADGPRRIKRRHVLGGVAAGFGGLLAASHLPRYSFAAQLPGGDAATGLPSTGSNGELLIVVFLRGGMDGLNALMPIEDPAYFSARPTLGVRNPLDLGNGWALNPALSSLKDLWDRWDLVALQGAGHPRLTRSHFEDEAAVELAAPAHLRSGWVARHLQSASAAQGTFRGVTFGNRTTLSLTTNAFQTIAMNSVAAFDLRSTARQAATARAALSGMYARSGDAAETADSVFRAIDELAAERAKGPTNTSGYPNHTFGRGLAEIARLAKAGVGMEAACIDLGDWDMHVGQGAGDDPNGWFNRLARVLGDGIAALRRDLGPLWERTTVVTMSEFGRRVAENASRGTDHGHGNVMFIASGRIYGQQLFHRIGGLDRDRLHLGDLPVGIDYRQPLAEILEKKLGNRNLQQVFPGFTPGPLLGFL